MANNQQLQQLFDALPQAEPPAALDNRIMRAVKQQLALENFHKADQLLNTQGARLDAETKSNLLAGMSKIKEQYGHGFEAAYSEYVAQQNATQANAKTNEPEHGLG